MSFACPILANLLLTFIFPTQGAAPSKNLFYGLLDHEISLDLSHPQVTDDADDIRWEKNSTDIARYSEDREPFQTSQHNKKYQVFKNGTLKIKHLEINDKGKYKVDVYLVNGTNIHEEILALEIQEAVSKPVISWDCLNTTLTCEVTKGTNYILRLYQNRNHIKEGNKTLVYRWSDLNTSFKCVAENGVSSNSSTVSIECPEKGLDIYLIVGICVAGTVLFIFVTLLILYISKRRKQSRRRNGEELEIRVHRITSEERSRKPHQIPGSAPQTPAASQPPPPPSHRTKAPGHRPPPPGHRLQHQHQHQKRPVPPVSTQGHQQKGPPLPRPRVQPKPPRGAAENS